MQELRTGLWHWQAPHPEWAPEAHWPEEVSSYAIDDGTQLLLVDPLVVPRVVMELAARRSTAVALTAPWHERDTRSLVEQRGAPVFVPRPDGPADLVRKYGVTLDQAAAGSPDVTWLVADDRGTAHWYSAGDRLPLGIQALPGWEHNDLVLWVERRAAIVVGDTLVDFGAGLQVNAFLPASVTREQIVHRLRPLLELPVEHVLATHGGPHDRAALERALC